MTVTEMCICPYKECPVLQENTNFPPITICRDNVFCPWIIHVYRVCIPAVHMYEPVNTYRAVQFRNCTPLPSYNFVFERCRYRYRYRAGTGTEMPVPKQVTKIGDGNRSCQTEMEPDFRQQTQYTYRSCQNMNSFRSCTAIGTGCRTQKWYKMF